MHLALLLAIIGPGPAKEGPQHHGFFLRADLGLGYYASSPGTTTFSGGGAGLGLSVGAGVAQNLAVFVSLFDAATADPMVSVGSVSQPAHGLTSAIAGFGAGLTYYFMPMNVFISGTLGVAQATVEQSGRTHQSRLGPIVRLGAGKEWMVSSSWGLGVAGYLVYAHNVTQDFPETTWNTVAPVVAFSATFY